MMYSMSTPQILFLQLYAVFVCTICLIVSSVAATKKKTDFAIKKAKELKHYSTNAYDFFSSDINSLSFTVGGEPVSLKRIASEKWGRYNSQKWMKKSFNNAFKQLFVIHATPL